MWQVHGEHVGVAITSNLANLETVVAEESGEDYEKPRIIDDVPRILSD